MEEMTARPSPAAALVAPWLTRVGSLLSLAPQSPPDAMGDRTEVAASVWLAWRAFKTLQEEQWIWLLETMELLDLFARVDRTAAWTFVLGAVGQSEYAPLIVESTVPLRFSMVVTDRVFLEQSFVHYILANGRMPALLESHTQDFVHAKHALLQLLPAGFKRSAETRIPLWLIQDPEDMNRQTHRSERLLTGLVALAEWWQQQYQVEDSPAACFEWSRLSLDCYDQVTLDRLASTTVRRLLQLGIEVDVLTPTNELPMMLRETQRVSRLGQSTGSHGGLRKLLLTNTSDNDGPSESFRDSCRAIYERHSASLVVTYVDDMARTEPKSVNEAAVERHWHWLALALFCVQDPLKTLPLRSVKLYLQGFSETHASAIEQVIADRERVLPKLKPAVGTGDIYSVQTTTAQNDRDMGALLCLRLWVREPFSVEAICRLIRSAGPRCRRFQLTPLDVPAERCEMLLRAVLDTSPSLHRLQVRYCTLASFSWLIESRTSQLCALSLREIRLSGNSEDLRALMEVLSDSAHALSHQLERLELEWSMIEPQFPALLDMLGRNHRLDRCVLWGITDSFTSDHRSLFKAREVLVTRPETPLPLRRRLAFLSVIGRLSDAGRPTLIELAEPVVSLIFVFAASCKRRQCLALEEMY